MSAQLALVPCYSTGYWDRRDAMELDEVERYERDRLWALTQTWPGPHGQPLLFALTPSETDFYEKMDEALRALDEFYRDMDLFEEEQAILDFMGEEPGWVAQLVGPERAARREASVKLPRCGE